MLLFCLDSEWTWSSVWSGATAIICVLPQRDAQAGGNGGEGRAPNEAHRRRLHVRRHGERRPPQAAFQQDMIIHDR